MNKIKILKKTALVLSLFLSLVMFLCACTDSNSGEKQLLRLHIRAASNDAADQEVKLKVRDSVVLYLESELCEIDDFELAKKEIDKRKAEIKKTADKVLAENGFSYKSTVKLNNEFFPTRMYEDMVVESGYYDALIIELGEGTGDNWWCVIYPPLCYVEVQYGSGFKYKSKIKELWDKYFG